ncbi:MAG TPA: LEPR-XLL domain-containing protein, partial [Tepidisphaeraceae bacterium]|nr:LEPR-XLL domain-containing protein [Tepidisphaeraceae bacterium]
MIESLEQRLLLSANVLGYHNDQFSTGANLQETALTPANVNINGFGKLYSTPVDGQVYAQPLYVSGLNVTAGSQPGTHNVVFVATERDSLYAMDAQTGAVLWQDSFLVPEDALTSGGNSVTVTTVPYTDVNTTDLQPEIGITSTPAIDLSSGYLYLTAKTKQIVNTDTADPHYVYTLYRVSIASGSFSGTVIADTTYNKSSNAYTYNSAPFVYDNLDPNHKGAGVVSQNGQYVINFNALRQLNRAAVTLYNGNVYLAFASHGDNTPYHGWILGYDESSLAPTAVFNANPDGNDDGIWQAGGRIAIDSQGFMYVETGNGAFDTTLNVQGFPQYGDYGDSFIKLALDRSTSSANQNVNGWGLQVADYFTPQNQASLSSSDEDLGSGGPLILPETAGSVTIGSAAHPDLLVGAGKQGMIYLIDRNNMGHFSATTDNVVQEKSGALPAAGSYDTPAFYYDGSAARFYYVAASSSGRSFSISNAAFALSSISADPYGSRDATTSISANGDTNGIAWNIDPGTGQLRAYDASNYANELWTSAQAPNARDTLGTALKFTTPT